MKHLVLVGLPLLLAWPATICAHAVPRERMPNIVVILADDLGYGDISCNNPARGKILTPGIDRIAAQGVRFTDAHSSSGVCSPSRYTLLTGATTGGAVCSRASSTSGSRH